MGTEFWVSAVAKISEKWHVPQVLEPTHLQKTGHELS